MSVEIASTRSNLFFSKLIRKITGEPISHIVIIVDDLWVIHSNFWGVHAEYVGDFQETSEIVERIPYNVSKDQVLDTLDNFHEASYDYLGMFGLGICLVLRRFLPLLVPKQNLWQTTGMFICTEFVSKAVFGQEDSLTTPGQLMERLRNVVHS
jgi:hypothetical protein